MRSLSEQRDMTAMALRINRQDITRLVEGCCWVAERRKSRPDVIADYLRALRLLTEAQERAVELGMERGPLAELLPPMPIWNDDYRWADVLARKDCLARAA